ncbi:MAG: T9SS type A sorting domain-containing protein [Bacteroidales bacterium]
MKTIKIMKNLNMILIALILGSFLPQFASAQEKANKELKLKIVKDENGSVTTVDTIINISDLSSDEEIQKLKELLAGEDFKNLGINLDDLEDLDNVYFFDTGEDGENQMFIVNKEIETDGDGESNIELMITADAAGMQSHSISMSSDAEGNYTYFISDEGDTSKLHKSGNKVFVINSEGEPGEHTFTISDEMVWTGDEGTHVEVESTAEGNTIKVTREDGTIQEYTVGENGTYMIDEDGKITKVEGEGEMIWNEKEGDNLVWVTVSDEGTNSKVIVKHMDENNGGEENEHMEKQIIITTEENTNGEDENVFVRKFDAKDGNKVVIVKSHVIIRELSDKDSETLEKSGVKMDEGKEILEIDDLTFNPNPNNGKFTLAFTTPDQSNTSIDIYDMNGKNVYTENIKNFNGRYEKEIDISNEKNGVYFLKIQQDNKISTRKIILE